MKGVQKLKKRVSLVENDVNVAHQRITELAMLPSASPLPKPFKEVQREAKRTERPDGLTAFEAHVLDALSGIHRCSSQSLETLRIIAAANATLLDIKAQLGALNEVKAILASTRAMLGEHHEVFELRTRKKTKAKVAP